MSSRARRFLGFLLTPQATNVLGVIALSLLAYVVVSGNQQTAMNRRQIIATKTIIQQQAADGASAVARQQADATRQAALTASAIKAILDGQDKQASRSNAMDLATRTLLQDLLTQVLEQLQAIRAEQQSHDQQTADNAATDQRQQRPRPVPRAPSPSPSAFCVVQVRGLCLP